MAVLRWLHKIWTFLLYAATTIFITLLVVAALIIGVLQLPASKEKISDEISTLFDKQFKGSLKFDSITGLLPFRAKLNSPKFYSPSDSITPVLSLERISIRLNTWDLLQRQLTISGFEFESPVLTLEKQNPDSVFTIGAVFEAENKQVDENSEGIPNWLKSYEIFAPSVEITNGSVSILHLPESIEKFDLSLPFSVDSLNASFFIEFNREQRFIELTQFSAGLPDTPIENIELKGQIFSDDQFFELNQFTIKTGLLNSTLNFETYPVDFLATDVIDKLLAANYRVQIDEFTANSDAIGELIPDFPRFNDSIFLEAALEGTIDTMYLDYFRSVTGESSIQMSGILQNLFSEEFRYLADFENIVISETELKLISDELDFDFSQEALGQSILRGNIVGSLTTLRPELSFVTNAGSVQLQSEIDFGPDQRFDISLQTDSLNLAPFLPAEIEKSSVNSVIDITGSGFSQPDLNFEATARLDSGFVNHINFTGGNMDFTYRDNLLNHNIEIVQGDSEITLNGSYSKEQGVHHVVLNSGLVNVNPRELLQSEKISVTDLNMEFETDLYAKNLNDLYGRISFDVKNAMAGSDSIQPHQLFADLTAPGNGNRNLRLTSTFFDGTISGTVVPDQISGISLYWYNYITDQLRKELFFEADSLLAIDVRADTLQNPAQIDLTLTGEIKNTSILKYYIKDFPEIESEARFTVNLNAGPERIIATANLTDPLFSINGVEAADLNANFTSSFRYSEPLKEFSTVDLQFNSSRFKYNDTEGGQFLLNASMRNDSLMVTGNISEISEKIDVSNTTLVTLMNDRVEVLLEEFSLGNEDYKWLTDGRPLVTFFRNESIQLEGFRFRSGSELLEVNGIISENPGDSLAYNLRNINLGRISDLIGGRVSFSGNANGDFLTRSLTTTPAVEGNFDINRIMINNRTIGDLNLRSRLNPEEDRFDTNISIRTDPKKYNRYYAENDSIGMNIELDGFIKIPEEQQEDNDLFYFDAELKEIDMWILTFIIPTIIEEMEGRASGTGFISGNTDDFDFNVDAVVDNVFARPVFVNTEYTINGNLNFNKTDGLFLDDLLLKDSQGGTGTLRGVVDINNFEPTTYLDLTLDLDNFHFMNNPFDPDIPFFASLYGTGQARLTGSNFSPLLRTTVPVSISSNSRFSIPLQDETEVESDRRFIQFVDSFDLDKIWASKSDTAGGNAGLTQEQLENLTFLERFTLDLQFEADQEINFQLIFDPLTNEVLNANGTGQIRLLLEDQTVSMFGRFEIQSGDYLFVSGDIFTRRFTLEPGGVIVWEGEPTNARLDLNAIFRARPDISTLLATTGRGAGTEPGTGQRVPVELVLGIGGTVSQIENDFFFRVPTGIEGSLDPTLSTQINNLNQNQDDKLLQATSILLTGNFIPLTQSQTEGGSAFGDQLSGTSVVVNPLLSSQIINPLLSNQINSLLSSDVSFDVDVNLNAYNEVDLGVALRLYNDRIVLRREGQITGEQGDIGDLGATYRISRVFSITAFHRQDPTLTVTTGTTSRQGQEMNGIGLEAQFQFNTWQEIARRFSKPFRQLFSVREEDENNPEKKQEDATASQGSD